MATQTSHIEVSQSIKDGLQQLNTIPKQPVSHITASMLKYLTGTEGVNKEIIAEEVNNFASMADIEPSSAQTLAKALLSVLKASFRAGLSSKQVQSDLERLNISEQITVVIVGLWTKYVHQPDPAPEEKIGVSTEPDNHPPEPKSADEVGSEVPLCLDAALDEDVVRSFDEFVDVQWSFGVTAASSDPARVGRTFVWLDLHLVTPSGQATVKKLQLSVTQFYSLLHQLEKSRALGRLM